MTRLSQRGALLLGGATVALAAVGVVGVRFLGNRSAIAAADAAALDRPVESGLEYTLDSLPNGVRYYVLAHAASDDRAELRLVVDAGSVQETEEQRGLAHGLEHMVFRGTRSFPHGAIDRYFDAIGMRRGNDVNATTSLDETEYRMTVPVTRAGAIDTALAMLASMAHEATFDPADARVESGVLLEEWRLSRGADARLGDARHPLIYAGTPYANRPVLGDTGVLRRLDPAALRSYYEAWYRPELMAVVAVGDFDPREVEAMIERHFGAIPAREPRRRRPEPAEATTPTAALRASVAADPEARNSWVGVWHPRPRQRYRSRADYREGLLAMLWQGMLRGRLEDVALRRGSPFASVDVERRTLARRLSADVVSVVAMKGETMAALETMVAETRELGRRGPTEAELEERGRAILRQVREQAQTGDGNAALAGEFVDHFLTGNAVFTSRLVYEMTRDILPTISVADIRAFAHARSADSGAVVVVAATSDDDVARATGDAIVARVRSSGGVALAHGGEVLDVRRLLASAPAAGTIVAERPVPEARAYEWTLSNGMHVLLKPTSFTFDEIQLRAVALGGASLATDDAYPSAYLADVIIGETGVGRIPAPRLDRWLASTSITLAPVVSDDAVALEGRTAPADVEAFFQLLHLYLTAPRRDTVAFQRYQARAASLAQDRGRDPAAVFRDSVVAALGGGDPRSMKAGAPFYLRARLDDALDFWTRRTANGAGFTVAIAGDFTLARMRPLVERYLASIPAGMAEHPRDRGLSPAAMGLRHDIALGIDARARTAIGFTAPFRMTNENMDALGAVRELIAHVLAERLRDELGGTYYVDVSLVVTTEPPTRYAITVEFESAPERMEALAAAATRELDRLRRRGPSTAQFQSVRETLVHDYDGRLEDNAFWVGELTFHASHGWPLGGITEHRHDAEALTIEALRSACATYIPAGDYVRVTARPGPATAP